MTVCPHCKTPKSLATGDCPRCDNGVPRALDLGAACHDDDDPFGNVPLIQTGPAASGAHAVSSYEAASNFDDDHDQPRGRDLELDVPMRPKAAPSGSLPAVQPPHDAGVAAPISTRSSLASGALSPEVAVKAAAPVPPPSDAGRLSPAEVVARYPAPPGAAYEAPLYACRVLWRKLELRQDLTSLRRRRSPDVPLYEAALRAHDTKMYALGLTITCAAVALATALFFLPVILRFAGD